MTLQIQSVHLGLTHRCVVCSKEFSSKSVLARHERAAHSEEALSCARCTYTTPYVANLTAHMRRVHGQEGFSAGRAIRGPRKALAKSAATHMKAMDKLTKEETERYLKTLSEKRGCEVTIENLKAEEVIDDEDEDDIPDELLKELIMKVD